MDSAFERHFSELVARERSGHTAVAEDNLLYVWGGYMVRKTNTHYQISPKEVSSLLKAGYCVKH